MDAANGGGGSGRFATRVRWTIVDVVVWAIALVVATSLRLDFGIPLQYEAGLLVAIALALVVQAVIGWVWGPYAVGHELGSFEESGELARATALTGAVLGVAIIALDSIELPRSVPVAGTVLALTGMFAARFVDRSRATRRAFRGRESRRAIVFGAGAGAGAGGGPGRSSAARCGTGCG